MVRIPEYTTEFLVNNIFKLPTTTALKPISDGNFQVCSSKWRLFSQTVGHAIRGSRNQRQIVEQIGSKSQSLHSLTPPVEIASAIIHTYMHSRVCGRVLHPATENAHIFSSTITLYVSAALLILNLLHKCRHCVHFWVDWFSAALIDPLYKGHLSSHRDQCVIFLAENVSRAPSAEWQPGNHSLLSE